ncbi:MAG TPA: 16S rRNA (cytidine(1402)-2'-O)-methyltransferase [Dehalococcoidia bacterium]|nr:16S rRNA (cytidine(1402)-2'-O)-methyltransferase [Dehalococcoidia bacterium]
MATLYLVATPIGNLEDITFRALRILREVPLIAAEDTRMARRLLDHFEIRRGGVTSYNEHNSRAKLPSILKALNEGDVALVSDAGMPGISDPGHDLTVATIAAGHTIVPVPGASAVLAAVAASGLTSRRFHYLGFLPRQGGPRRAALIEAAKSGDTLVVFESPHRVRATLEDVRAALGERRVAAARELTKLHEEIWRGTVSEALAHFAEPRGEFTLVIAGGPPAEAADAASVNAVIGELRASGTRAKDAIAVLSERFGLSRREAYRLWHADG